MLARGSHIRKKWWKNYWEHFRLIIKHSKKWNKPSQSWSSSSASESCLCGKLWRIRLLDIDSTDSFKIVQVGEHLGKHRMVCISILHLPLHARISQYHRASSLVNYSHRKIHLDAIIITSNNISCYFFMTRAKKFTWCSWANRMTLIFLTV